MMGAGPSPPHSCKLTQLALCDLSGVSKLSVLAAVR
jgi:hypothetical protein